MSLIIFWSNFDAPDIIFKLNRSELHGQEECKITQHEFQNHVETQVHDQPLPGTRPSPDYLEPDLIQSRVLAHSQLAWMIRSA